MSLSGTCTYVVPFKAIMRHNVPWAKASLVVSRSASRVVFTSTTQDGVCPLPQPQSGSGFRSAAGTKVQDQARSPDPALCQCGELAGWRDLRAQTPKGLPNRRQRGHPTELGRGAMHTNLLAVQRDRQLDPHIQRLNG